MSDRPVIIGMNNPHSTDPQFALYPYPSGVAGHRLWRMLDDAHEGFVSRQSYLDVFDRRNLLSKRRWDRSKARRSSIGLWETLARRTVLVLGQEVREILHLPRTDPLVWHETEHVHWCLVPHPSGRNYWYNDQTNREAAGRLLSDLYTEAVSALE